MAALVAEAAGVLAAAQGGVVHVVHTQEETAGDVAIDGESLEEARALVRDHLDQLAAQHVPAEGQILLHAADHGAAGRMVAEYANTIGARTIVVGAPTHGGLPALMDESASRELWRHARSNVLVVNPNAPGASLGVVEDQAEGVREHQVAEDVAVQRVPVPAPVAPWVVTTRPPGAAPSWTSSCCLRSTPPASPRMPPSEPTTRWHGR